MKTQSIEEQVENLRLKMKQGCICLNCETFNENIGAGCVIREALTLAHNQGKAEGVQECIKLSDDIEFREPDGGTKQWMAFKCFRNTMRDKLKTLTE